MPSPGTAIRKFSAETSVPFQLLEKLGYAIEALPEPLIDRETSNRYQYRATTHISGPTQTSLVQVLFSPITSGSTCAKISVSAFSFNTWNHDMNRGEFTGSLILAELVARQERPAGQIERVDGCRVTGLIRDISDSLAN